MYKYKVIFDKKRLCGTNYMEIGPGNKCKTPWIDGNIFIDDFDFFIVEDAIKIIDPEFDHYSFNIFDSNKGILVCDTLKQYIKKIEIGEVNIPKDCENPQSINDYVERAMQMFTDIETYCRKCCVSDNGFYVFGV